MILTCSKQYLHHTKREDLTESTGVMPAKYPPKVKLELLITLECQSWVNYAYLDLWGSWGFYSSVVLASVPWLRRCFLVGERLFISRILRNPFLVGVFLIRAKCGAQDISLYTLCVRTTQETWLTCQLHLVNLSFHDTSFWSSLTHALMTFSCSRHPQYGYCHLLESAMRM